MLLVIFYFQQQAIELFKNHSIFLFFGVGFHPPPGNDIKAFNSFWFFRWLTERRGFSLPLRPRQP